MVKQDHRPDLLLESHAQANGQIDVAVSNQLSHIGDARQLLVVTSDAAASSCATLQAYQRGVDGVWRLVFGPMRARSGYAGWVWGARESKIRARHR